MNQPPTAFERGLPTAFAAGDVLCARFEVLRFLAQGGMGEVYEARDLELGETVALKTIRPEVAGDPRVLQRFKREIALARRVTHPNVCRVFDLFHHSAPDRSGRSTTFLAMQMLHGETLAARAPPLGAAAHPRGAAARASRWRRGCRPLTRKGSSTATSSRAT